MKLLSTLGSMLFIVFVICVGAIALVILYAIIHTKEIAIVVVSGGLLYWLIDRSF